MREILNKNIPLYVTDGGLETTMIFKHGFELPQFAACVLLDNVDAKIALQQYFESYLKIAEQHGTGCILETPTWRAGRRWLIDLGYQEQDIHRINYEAVQFLKLVSKQFDLPLLISGTIGPVGDGYTIDNKLTVEQAKQTHEEQVMILKASGVDLISAFTMNYIDEALGIVKAAAKYDIPVVISFTTELDGHLPSGESLEKAITVIDELTNSYPSHYMINCAHPTHFSHLLGTDSNWQTRIMGVRANASECSHAELDEATELDEGNPIELAKHYQQLKTLLPNLKVLGGCCGTDNQHVEMMVTTH